jgi:tetratricopeptide (TPR) repeat protein
MGAGAAAWRSGEWSAARASFRLAADAAATDDERAMAWFNEANAAARMNHIEAAVTLLDRVLEIHPGHTRAARNRALLQELRHAGDPRDSGAEGVHQDPEARQQTTARDAARDAPDAGGGFAAQGEAVAATGSGGPAAATGAPAADGSGFAAAQRSADRDAGTPLPPVADDPREVLRHRFMVMDAKRVLLPETQPW